MEEFLLQYKNYITHALEFLAAFTGLFLYKKYKGTAAIYFILFLLYLSICDTLGGYVRFIRDDGILSFLEGTKFRWNYWWSTLFWQVGAIVFFSFFYYKILKTNIFKRIIKYFGYTFFTFSVILIISNWEHYFTRYFPAISVFGALIIFLCCTLYFIELLQSDRILNFYRSLNFYITVAIFIWWLIITPLVFYDIYNANRDWNFRFLKWQIYLCANLFMYLTYTFALIWCKPEND